MFYFLFWVFQLFNFFWWCFDFFFFFMISFQLFFVIFDIFMIFWFVFMIFDFCFFDFFQNCTRFFWVLYPSGMKTYEKKRGVVKKKFMPNIPRLATIQRLLKKSQVLSLCMLISITQHAYLFLYRRYFQWIRTTWRNFGGFVKNHQTSGQVWFFINLPKYFPPNLTRFFLIHKQKYKKN